MQSGWEFHIDSRESLEEAAEYYHDQHFAIADISYDERGKTFSVEFWRVLYKEAKKKRDFLIYQVLSAPVVRTKLIFQNVDEMKILDEQPVDEMITILYESTKREIRIICCNGTRILLRVNRLDGIMADIGEQIPDAHYYVTLLYWIEIGYPWQLLQDMYKDETTDQQNHTPPRRLRNDSE
ncbi:MAG: DUF2948 family protein [candidate division WOR-3 bacterium]|nr:DUF2948 family protein [candidate division WOR-3 bacterium]